LIDYKKFRDWILKGQDQLRKQMDAEEQQKNLSKVKSQTQQQQRSEKIRHIRRSSSMNHSIDKAQAEQLKQQIRNLEN